MKLKKLAQNIRGEHPLEARASVSRRTARIRRPLSCSTACRGLICPGPVLLCRAPHRDEPYLDSLIQCAADPSQHCQGMAFVIRVFKAADDRCRGTDELGKLRLSVACRCAQCADFAGDLFVRPRLFKLLQPTWPACVEATVQDLHCITSPRAKIRPSCSLQQP